jgi:hypothetical protein
MCYTNPLKSIIQKLEFQFSPNEGLELGYTVGILVLLELKWIVCELSVTTAADLSLIISVTNKVPTKIG